MLGVGVPIDCRDCRNGCGVTMFGLAYSEFGCCSCQPTFSGGYSLEEAYGLFEVDWPSALLPGVSSHCRASLASFGTPMYFDSRFVLSSRPPSPWESASHHRLAGRPRESASSNASLTLMLSIGDNDGMYCCCEFQFVLPDAPLMTGECCCCSCCCCGRPADGGAELDCTGSRTADPKEFRCDFGSDV